MRKYPRARGLISPIVVGYAYQRCSERSSREWSAYSDSLEGMVTMAFHTKRMRVPLTVTRRSLMASSQAVKTTDFDSVIRRFESYLVSQFPRSTRGRCKRVTKRWLCPCDYGTSADARFKEQSHRGQQTYADRLPKAHITSDSSVQ